MKYSLSSFYKDFVKEKILKKYLSGGKIPSSNEIDKTLNETIAISNEFRNPLLSSLNYYVENGETSSAKKTNEVYETIESDLTVCVKALLDQEDKVTNLYDTAFSKLKGLQNKVNLVKEEVENLLFQSNNTDIHEELFYEKFSSLDMVDQELSTVTVDLGSKEVVLSATSQNSIDVTPGVASVQVIPESNPKIVGSTDVGEMTIYNIFNNSNKVWMHQINASESLSTVYLDIFIRIPTIKDEVNKIVFEPYSVDIKTQTNIEIAHSADGLNWTYPDGEYRKRLDKTTSLSFAGISKEYWRIRLTKVGNDGFFSNFYVYNFGLKSLNFLGKSYDKVSKLDAGIFYSRPLYFKKDVNMANVKVCDNIPSSTSIKYHLAPIYESKVADLSNGTITAEDIFYYNLDLTDKKSVTLDFLNSSTAPILNGLVDENLSYKDKGFYDYCLDFVLPQGFIKNETTLLRSALDQTAHSQPGIEIKVNGTISGWQFDGNYYSTYLLIEDHNGYEIDLGSTELYVNNKAVQGKVVIPRGLNFIVTHRDNWKSLDMSTLPLEADQVVDQLYPYNHKYLIEGLGQELYGRDLNIVIDGMKLVDIIDKNRVYKRTVNKLWATKMREYPFDNFVSKNENELDAFSYKIDNTNQERIIVKYNPELGLLTSETFSIITKLHSAEKIKGLIFKAVMETESNKVSPTFTEYLVKIK